MSAVVEAATAWPQRSAPESAGDAGLALALLVIVVLTVQLFRAQRRERTVPGPVPRRRPAREIEWRTLHWASASVLVLVLAVVVVERVVVLT